MKWGLRKNEDIENDKIKKNKAYTINWREVVQVDQISPFVLMMKQPAAANWSLPGSLNGCWSVLAAWRYGNARTHFVLSGASLVQSPVSSVQCPCTYMRTHKDPTQT